MDMLTGVLMFIGFIILAMYYYRQWKAWSKSQANLTWPRELSVCPDYWTHEGAHICRNTFDIGSCPKGIGGLRKNGTVDMKAVSKVVGKEGADLDNAMREDISLKSKCKWSKKCNASWEGIDKMCA